MIRRVSREKHDAHEAVARGNQADYGCVFIALGRWRAKLTELDEPNVRSVIGRCMLEDEIQPIGTDQPEAPSVFG